MTGVEEQNNKRRSCKRRRMRSRSRVQGEEGECRLQGEEWTMKGSDCKCGVSQGSSNTMRMVMLWTVMRIRKWMIIK